jgi:divalent metal cation (Fe/Co/Zn/Cd) transporter
VSPHPVELPLVVTNVRVSPPADLRLGDRADRERLMRRARQLSLLSIAWMSVEAGVAITSALIAGSVALLGFGLDSLIELASAATILWLYTAGRGDSAQAERHAQRMIAICFAALAVYLAFDAINSLAHTTRPNTSWPGVAVTAGAIVFMPTLARAKSRVAAQLTSTATAGDAAQSWLCTLSAVAVLLSILANTLLGWWWLDPAAALGIAGLAIHESRDTWCGDTCADCAPIGFNDHDDCGCC